MKRSLAALLPVITLLACAIPVRAQINPNLEVGLKPYGAYDASDFDSVSMTNQNLFLHIPFLSYPQRGSLTDKRYLVYNGKNFSVQQTCNSHTNTCTSKWVWGPLHGHGPSPGLYSTSTNSLGLFVTVYKTPTNSNWWSVFGWDGSTHETGFRSSDGTSIAIDGSGYRYNPNGVIPGTADLRARDGSIPYFEDTNGNLMDTLSRTSGPPPTADTTGCVGPMGMAATISTYPGLNGADLQVKTCTFTGTVNTNFQVSNSDPYGNVDPITELQTTETFVVTVIVFDGNSWTTSPKWAFTYDAGAAGDHSTHYGDLLSVTLPTGGTISYTWTTLSLCGQGLVPVSRGVTARTLNANDSLGILTTSYNYGNGTNGNFLTIQTDPAHNDTVHVISMLGGSCSYYETETDYYQGTGTGRTLLKTVKTTYQYVTDPYNSIGDGTYNLSQVFPTSITTVWPNGKTSQITKTYDTQLGSLAAGAGSLTSASFGNVLEEKAYDYGSGAPGSLLRRADYTYLAFSNPTYMTAHMIDRVSAETVYNGGGTQVAQTTYGYDEYGLQTSGAPQLRAPYNTVRGNRTSVHHWLNTTGGTLNTTTTYYDSGMPYHVTDSAGNVTTYSYSLTYAGAYLTQTTMPVTGGVAHVISGTYDYNTGKLMTFTDQNSNTSSYSYDSLWRARTGSYPDGGLTTINYPDLWTIEVLKKIDASRSTDAFTHFDGLAREIRHVAVNDESTPDDQVDTCYNNVGEKSFVTYPYQGNGSLTAAQICSGAGDSFAYDAIGRTTTVTHSDGSSVVSSYTGRASSVTDEGNGTHGVQRISQMDGLGRLASVCEVTGASQMGSANNVPSACGLDVAGNGFLTSYSFDALGNLASASQAGLAGRSFVYDSLSRLTSATNPESGSTLYKYDADASCASPNSFTGDLVSKTDARGVRTCLQYDALHRLTQKNYSDGMTPTVFVAWDGSGAWGATQTNMVGRIEEQWAGISCCATTGAEIFSYDTMGRVLFNTQYTPTLGYDQINYSYDLAGDMTSHGASIVISKGYNRALRLTSVTSNLVDSTHPATLLSALHYNGYGEELSGTLGNGLALARTYTARGWLSTLTDGPSGSPVYNLGVTSYAPDGNPLAASDSVNGNWNYAYDDFNRLCMSNQGGQSALNCGNSSNNIGSQAYSYAFDRYGNRWNQTVTAGAGQTSSMSFSGGNNRIDGRSYDAAGNLLNDGAHQYFYDAENRVMQVDGTPPTPSAICGSGATACYGYDAQGRRVIKTTSSGTVNYTYDLESHPVQEFNSSAGLNRMEIYAGAKHLATYANSTTYFIHADWLGTERARSTVAGASCETTVSLPYGDGQSSSGSCGDPSPLHFTGKQRDTESNLDYFGARYYSSSLGRFVTPDWATAPTSVPYAHFGDPQSLNLYSYVRNNPAFSRDIDGHCSGDDACSHNLSVEKVTGIVYNESKSLKGNDVKLSDGRQSMAHAIINGDNEKGEKRPKTATDKVTESDKKTQVYKDTKEDVKCACDEAAKGVDPTGGAIYFNMRPNDSTGPFQGADIQTQSGPLQNSAPSAALPKDKDVYVNTYKPPDPSKTNNKGQPKATQPLPSGQKPSGT